MPGMSNDNDLWTLQREPNETDAEYESRAGMFRVEFARQLPDGRTIEQALADGDGVGVDLREPGAAALRILRSLPSAPPEPGDEMPD
jgi:hypothetical protein